MRSEAQNTSFSERNPPAAAGAAHAVALQKKSFGSNEILTLDGIPPETIECRINSALEALMDRYQMVTDKYTATVSPFQGGAGLGSGCLGLRAGRFTPGYHRTGFQPSAQEPSALRYRVLVVRRLRSEGAQKTAGALRRRCQLSGLKAPNVTAWAEASPTSGGPGQTFALTPHAL